VIMKDEIILLVKRTWCDYFNGDQNKILETINPEIKDEYIDAMLLLENNETFMKTIIG